MISISERVTQISYAIRELVVYAKELEKKGKEVIYLNIGDPNYYDFDTPDYFKEALNEAVREGHNGYSDSQGILELREAIAKRERHDNNVNITPDDVYVTLGVSEAINFILTAILKPGDEILVPGPTYPTYFSLTKYNLGVPIFYKCDEKNGWNPDLEDIEKKITPKTKAIVVINPNNPTGAVYDTKIVKEIINLAAQHNILFISDEIYDRIVFDGPYSGAASLEKDVPKVIVNGFSKVYIMPGWRLGYIYFADEEGKLQQLRAAIDKQSKIRICATTPIQYAVAKALKKPQIHIKPFVDKLRERRDFAYKRLSEINGLNVVIPKGAFYIFPEISTDIRNNWKTDKDFVIDLLTEKQVLFVNGSGFGEPYGAWHFRSVFLPPIDIMDEAFNRVEEFLNKKSRSIQ
ncbi:MAG: aminotransferase class I/II-fold pyridoxal phosphate-dependent enzyme [Candidatus Asgardarchaeia archaeon]